MTDSEKKAISFSGFLVRTIFPAAATIGLFVAAIFLFYIPFLERTFLDQKRQTVRELVNSSWSILATCHAMEEKGQLTRQEAQERARDLIGRQRYGSGNKDYFWINDRRPILLVHPYRPDLVGQDLSDYQDKKGKRLFLEFVKAVDASPDGEGYVDYWWQWKDDPGKIAPKLSFVKLFPPWQWILGTGIYVQDVHQEVAALKGRVLSVFLATLAVVVVLVFLLFCQSIMAAQRSMSAVARVQGINVLLKAIRAVGTRDDSASDRDQLLRRACDSLVDSHKYSKAWIAALDGDRRLVTLAQRGHSDQFHRLLPALKEGRVPGLCGQCLQDREVQRTADTGATCSDCPLSQEHGREAALAVRLEYNGKVYGLLNASTDTELSRDSEELDLLREIADDLAFGLATIETNLAGARTDEAYREHLEQYDKTLATSREGILISDLESGVIMEVNDSLLAMIGMERDKVLGSTVADLGIWESPEELRRFLAAIKKHGECRDLPITLTPPGGPPLPGLVSARQVEVSGETRVLSVFQDLTETKRMEEELRLSEVRYRSLFQAMLDGYALCEIIQDQDGLPCDFIYLEINDAFEKITGLAREQVIGRRALQVQPGTDGNLVESYAEVALTGRPLRFVRYDRSLDRHFEVVAFQPRSRQFAISFRDITETVKAERNRRRLQTHLVDSQRLESLGAMAGRMAHDFNNLLMGILGHAELAMDDLQPDTSTHERILQIEEGARKASHLCYLLQAFSGTTEGSPEPTGLADLLADMEGFLRLTIPPPASLALDQAPHLPQVLVDPSQLRQLIMNLVHNAINSLEGREGRITLSTGLEGVTPEQLPRLRGAKPARPGEYVALRVADTGRGMDDRTVERIFDPFFSTDPDRHGLGMAAVLGIVRTARGQVLVDSRPGAGTTVSIYLPPADQTDRSGPTRQPQTGDSRRTVLLVDDDTTVLAVAKVMLERSGYQVLTAGDGQEGLDLFKEQRERIGLTILDMTMPKLSGLEVLREIRSIEPGAKVVLSSGYSRESALKGVDPGSIAGFIQKPYRRGSLTKLVRQCLPECQ